MDLRTCRAWFLSAALAVMAPLANGAHAQSESNPLFPPVEMQDYVPGGRAGGEPAKRGASSAAPKQTAPKQATPSQQPPSSKRGSGTSPNLLTPPQSGPALVQPSSRDTTGDTARFKRDLAQPGVDALKQKNDLGRLDPFQQRDLFNREQELHRLQTDPMRR